MNKKRKILTLVAVAVFGAIIFFHYYITTCMWLFRWASIAFYLWAAWCWYEASTVKITTRDKNPHKPEIEIRGNSDSDGHRVLYSSTVMEQSERNKNAAIYTAIAVVLQAVALLLEALRQNTCR